MIEFVNEFRNKFIEMSKKKSNLRKYFRNNKSIHRKKNIRINKHYKHKKFVKKIALKNI